MATVRWRGDAASVAQVCNLAVGGTPLPGDVFSATINGKVQSYTEGSAATVADVCAGLVSTLSGSTIPEFQEIVWTDPLPTAVIATAATPGLPFTLSIALTKANLASPVLAAPTLNAGGALAGTTYYYKLTALNPNGETLPSNEVSITTSGSGLSVIHTWPAVPGATGYKLYRGTAAGSENVLVATINDGAATAFTDVGETSTAASPPGSNTATIPAPVQNNAALATSGTLTVATPYYWVLTATTAAGETVVSNEKTLTPTTGNQKGVISWTAVGGATGYKIYRSATSGTYGATSLVTTIGSGATVAYTDTGAATGTGAPPGSNTAVIPAPSQAAATTATPGGCLAVGTYYYTITATTAAGQTVASGEQSQATTDHLSTVGVSWFAVAGATGYKVYRGTAAGGENVLIGTVGASMLSFMDVGGVGTTGATLPGSNTALSTATFALTTPTASNSPNDVNTPANWSTGSVPVTGDNVYIQNSGSGLLYSLAALSGATLASLTIDSTFTGAIGLPQRNPAGYWEYRPLYWQIGATLFHVLAGSGGGSSLIQINFGSVQVSADIASAAQSGTQGRPAIILLGTHAANVMNITQGVVGSAIDPGDVSTWSVIGLGYQNNQPSDVSLTLGTGCTLTTINQDGGVLTYQSALTTLTMTAGTANVVGSAATATLNCQNGTCNYQSTGTVTTLTVGAGGVVDYSHDPRGRTVTNATVYGALIDPNQTVTHTNPVSFPNGLGGQTGATLNWGTGIRLARS